MSAFRHQIVFVDRTMMVLDGCGRRYDEFALDQGAELYWAKMKIAGWKMIYPSIDATRAKRELSRYVAQF